LIKIGTDCQRIARALQMHRKVGDGLIGLRTRAGVAARCIKLAQLGTRGHACGLQPTQHGSQLLQSLNPHALALTESHAGELV